MKLCYILPEYNENIADHFYHQYELLKELSEKLGIFLVIEKANVKKINFGNFKKVYIQKFKFLPLRFLESFLVVLRARVLGYKNFYTHYCYIGGINAGIISRLCKGQSYYWHCEMIWEFKQNLFSKIGLKLCLKLSHFLVTGSENLKKQYAKYYRLSAERVKILPNWINLKRFKPKSENLNPKSYTLNPKLLFVHWLSERKGAYLIVPIIKQLVLNPKSLPCRQAGQILNPKFLIIGDGPLKEKIQKEVKKNKLEKFIKILGKVPHKNLIKYYVQADIFIMPSLQEGFPRVLIEAMAMGIPYVASDVGAVREISPKIAQDFIVERGDIQEFAKKINLLLSDKEVYNRFKKEELEKVKEYSLKKTVNKFIKLFE